VLTSIEVIIDDDMVMSVSAGKMTIQLIYKIFCKCICMSLTSYQQNAFTIFHEAFIIQPLEIVSLCVIHKVVSIIRLFHAVS